jgi:NAD(P)-dependent dehydrogenase (short-subunit alcohol dehydrogenase family)
MPGIVPVSGTVCQIAASCRPALAAYDERMANENNDTSSKIALITGGSRGLGRSMALHLADQGVDVIFTYRSAASEAESVRALLVAKGRKALALPLDVGDSESFDAFAERLRAALAEHWGRSNFDFLVNNAGMGLRKSFLETTEAEFDELFKVHLRGPYFLTQKLVPLLADGGRVINLSSGLARFSMAGSSAYAVMKGGVEVLTRYLATELASRRITVNTLAPGAIATDFNGGLLRDNPGLNQAVASHTALGRVGLPDDIGGAVAVLLAPEAGWITGQRIEASGGMHM